MHFFLQSEEQGDRQRSLNSWSPGGIRGKDSNILKLGLRGTAQPVSQFLAGLWFL